MTDAPIEQLAYELPEIWEEDWFPREDRERVRALATLIDPRADTLLDVGCGNGLFLNHLQATQGERFKRLAGADRSNAALAHVKTEKHVAGADRLPFSDREFHTVTSFEVLEHLPDAIYKQSLGEIARVASHSIAICVPYREDLQASLCACPNCAARFNPDFHVRSYDEAKLGGLFARLSFHARRTEYLGRGTVRYDHLFRARLRSVFVETVPAFPSYAICPHCGFMDREKLKRDLEERKQATPPGDAPESSPRSLRARVASWLPRKTVFRWIAVIYVRV